MTNHLTSKCGVCLMFFMFLISACCWWFCFPRVVDVGISDFCVLFIFSVLCMLLGRNTCEYLQEFRNYVIFNKHVAGVVVDVDVFCILLVLVFLFPACCWCFCFLHVVDNQSLGHVEINIRVSHINFYFNMSLWFNVLKVIRKQH